MVFTMSAEELDRLQVIQRVDEKRLSQREAARILGRSPRSVRRWLAAYRAVGASSVPSKLRGRPSNHQLPSELRRRAVELVREKYADFGPTFANEKLAELHEVHVSVETLRKWMVDDGLWVPRAKRTRTYQPRNRRSCFGELVQFDSCLHHWFEDRGPRSSLLVFGIDQKL